MLLAAIEAASLYIAEAPDPEGTLRQSVAALDRLLEGLRVSDER